MTQLNEAIRQKDFGRATGLVLKYLRKKLGNKVYLYPVPERFISAGGSMTGIRFFMESNKSIRFNWKSTIDASNGLLSMDYWDGSKLPQPNPSEHIKFDEAQSLVKVLPFVVEFLDGKVDKSGIYVTESVSPEFNLLLDFRTDLTEATYTSGELAKTVSNIINALKNNIPAVQAPTKTTSPVYTISMNGKSANITADQLAAMDKNSETYKQIASALKS